jgi:hypothetical protein
VKRETVNHAISRDALGNETYPTAVEIEAALADVLSRGTI